MFFPGSRQLARLLGARLNTSTNSAPVRRGPAFASLAGKAARRHGELHCELFIVTLCRISACFPVRPAIQVNVGK
jgi:hypothetical protein